MHGLFLSMGSVYTLMATKVVTVVCPHCSNQMGHKVSGSGGTVSVTCSMGRGGCGKSFRVCISGGELNWVK